MIGPARRLLKAVLSVALIPAVRRYTAVERSWRYGDLHVRVLPGVFHPGLFGSTRSMLDFLSRVPITPGSRFLELGAGCGVISLSLAARGARVTATDISRAAVANLNINLSATSARVIHSDLFNDVPAEPFEGIIINPPYYRGTPRTEEDFAWYCGRDLDYFRRLFDALPRYVHGDSLVLMVVSAAADLTAIERHANRAGFQLNLRQEKFRLLEYREYIYRIVMQPRGRGPLQ